MAGISRRGMLGSLTAIGAAAALLPAFGTRQAAAVSQKALLPASPALRLDSNENSLGMSPRAKRAVTKALAIGNRYPDDHVADLKSLLSARLGVTSDHLTIGAGSTQVIWKLMRHFKSVGGSTVIAPTPTFGLVARIAGRLGLRYRTVPTGPDFVVDLDAMRGAMLEAVAAGETPMMYMVTPNNPTGRLIDSAGLLALAKDAPPQAVFLMDEAYDEYVSDPAYESALSLVKAGQENVFITRTFSKVYGMAGLRMGYGIAVPHVAERVRLQAEEWNNALPGLVAAKASLEDGDWLARSRRSNAEAKEIAVTALAALDLRVQPSETNFILHQIRADHAEYKDRMYQAGVWVGRYMDTGPGWNRLSIGTPEEMMRFADIAQSFRSKGWI